MVITYSKGNDQPGKIVNPARGQLAEQGRLIIPCPRSRLRIWSREDGFGNPVLHQSAHLHTQAESGAYLRNSSRVPRRRPFIIGTHYVL